MLRIALALCLIVVAGGLAYLLWPVAAPASSQDEARSRSMDALPPPPSVGPSASSAPPVQPANEIPGQPHPEPPTIAPVPGATPPELQQSSAVGDASAFTNVIGTPIAGLKADQIKDTFNDTRDGERRHEASDIMAPRGTPVLAVDNGIVQKLFTSKPGGLTIYQFDQQQRFCYYYAHLDRYAEGLREGMLVKRGDVIGYVGFTGNASPEAPHLHFAILELGPSKQWYADTKPINPYPFLLNVTGASRSRKNK